MRIINDSISHYDFRIPPSNGLELPKGDGKGQFSIRMKDHIYGYNAEMSWTVMITINVRMRI